MSDAVTFSYSNYAKFSGRASRSEYWYWTLFFYLAWFGGIIFLGAIVPELGPLYSLIFFFSSIVPTIARGVRRLHDTNKPGSYLLFGLIPFVGGILLLVWFCTKGDPVGNRYGPSTGSPGPGGVSPDVGARSFPPPPDLETKGSGPQIRSLVREHWLFALIAVLFIVPTMHTLYLNIQMGRLVTGIEASEDAMTTFGDQSEALWTRTTSNGNFKSSWDQERFESGVKELAKTAFQGVSTSRDRIIDVSFLIWLNEERDLKASYLAHNKAWQGSLSARSADPYAAGFPGEIESTWNDFCARATNLDSFLILFDIDKRLATVCSSSTPENPDSL